MRITNIGKFFPVIFFLVAALVSLTTMTRMIEEQRQQIGTLKALGYGDGVIAVKYLAYGLMFTISGAFVGVLLGEKNSAVGDHECVWYAVYGYERVSDPVKLGRGRTCDPCECTLYRCGNCSGML